MPLKIPLLGNYSQQRLAPILGRNRGLLFSNFANEEVPYNNSMLPLSLQNYNVPQFDFSNAQVNASGASQLNPTLLKALVANRNNLSRVGMSPQYFNIPQAGGQLLKVAEVAMPKMKKEIGKKIGGALMKSGIGQKLLAGGTLAKVGTFLANPAVGIGLGLLGSVIGARRAAKRSTSAMPSGLQNVINELENPDISEFREIAREGATSFTDLSRLAQATGGSQSAASAQAMSGQTRAMDAALQAYQQQQQANQGMLANIYSQQYAAQQADRAYRRQTGVDIFSNIANLGAGLLGQRYGSMLQDKQNTNFFNQLNKFRAEQFDPSEIFDTGNSDNNIDDILNDSPYYNDYLT